MSSFAETKEDAIVKSFPDDIEKIYMNSEAGDALAVEILRERLSEGAEIIEYGSKEWNERMKAYSPQGNQIPAFVIECATENDVVESVKFSRGLNLPFVARNGAHNLAELSMIHGGVIILQSNRNNIVNLNLEEESITFEGGCKFNHVDEYLYKNAPGWAMQSAMISSIGITGSHLALGVGWLQRLLGNGIDNILSVRMVMSDGTIQIASKDENPDLFFAVRGAGHNYGIVTQITEKIHNILDPNQGKEVRVGCFLFDVKDGEAVWETVKSMNEDPEFPDSAFILPLFILVEGKPSIILWLTQFLYANGTINTEQTRWELQIRDLVSRVGAVALAPNSLSPSTVDGWEDIDYMETQALFNPPWMCSFYPSGGFVPRENADKVFEKVLTHWREGKQPDGAEQVPFHTTAFYHFGGSKQRNRERTAWPGNAETSWLCATWGGVLTDQDPALKVKRSAETKEWVDKLRKEIGGDLQFGYLCAAAYNWRSVNHARWIHGESFPELVQVKAKFDPKNIMYNNVNIPPDAKFI